MNINSGLTFPIQEAPLKIGDSIYKAMQAQLAQEQARGAKASAIEQEQKNPFVAAIEKERLRNAQQVNEWYAPNMRSEIAYRGAGARHMGMEDKKIQQLLDYPGLDQTGYIGQLAQAHYAADHPEMAKSLQLALGQQQLQQQMMQQQQMQLMQQQQSQQSPFQGMTPSSPNIQMTNEIASMLQNQPSQTKAMQQMQTAPPESQQGFQGQGGPQGTGQETLFNPVKALLEHEPYRAAGIQSIHGVNAQNMALLREQIKRDYGVDDEKANDISNAWLSGETVLSDGTAAPLPKGNSETILTDIYHHNRTAQQSNQERFANTLETLFKAADENADAAFEFSGVAGKTQGGIEALTSQVGEDDPKYLKYRKFIDQDVPSMVTEIVRTSGANSTDSQKAMAIMQAMPMNMLTSTAVAKSSYGELKKLYRAVAKSISKTPYQINKENRQQSDGSSQSSGNNTYFDWKDGNIVEAK